MLGAENRVIVSVGVLTGEKKLPFVRGPEGQAHLVSNKLQNAPPETAPSVLLSGEDLKVQAKAAEGTNGLVLTNSIRARVFIGLVLVAGVGSIIMSMREPGKVNSIQFVCYLLLTLLSGGLKVVLPGVTGTMSVSFLFILLGVAELSMWQTMILGLSASFVQCYWRAKIRPGAVQVLFNLAAIAIAIAVAFSVYHSPIATVVGHSMPIMLLLSAASYFAANTLHRGCISTARPLLRRPTRS